MGVASVRQVLEHSPTIGTDRLVLLVLAERADDASRTCWPGVELIASEAGVKVRAAQYALKALAEAKEMSHFMSGIIPITI